MPTYTSQPAEAAAIDTYIRADQATTNYATGTDVIVGHYQTGAGYYRGLIKDPFTGLVGVVVTSAVLTLTVSYGYDTPKIYVYRSKRAWVESQATWNIWKTSNNWSTAGGFHTDDCEQTDIGNNTLSAAVIGTQLAITLDAAKVQEMISGAFTNNGFLLKSTEADNTISAFASSSHATASYRPKLVIEYILGGQFIRWSNE